MCTLLFVVGCDDDDEAIVLSRAEKNAQKIDKILRDNTIRWVDVLEYSTGNGEWQLAIENQSYTEGKKHFYVEGTFFVLDGTSGMMFNGDPTREVFAINYFDLEYLVSFDLHNDELYLYFVY